MKLSTLFASGCLLLCLAATGCSAPTDEAVESAESDVTGKLTAAELAATKQTIRAIAYANIDRTDNWDEIRAELTPHIKKLERHYGKRLATAKVGLVKGAWRQIWSDFPFPGPSFIKMDPRQVYQVVTDEGYYYNFGDNRALGIFGVTSVLRGSYRPDGTKLVVQFTKTALRFGTLGKNEDLYELATGLENGTRFSLSTPGGGKAPKGPVGVSGTLENVYCDADLRIDVGTQTDFEDASGNVLIPGVGPKYFILDRVSSPVK